MTLDGNVYLLQYGSYINKDVMEENVKRLKNYFTYEEDNKYYVFLGIFTDIINANNFKKIMEEEKIYTYIKNDYIGDTKLIEKIKDYEKLINEENILEINNKIIDFIKKER